MLCKEKLLSLQRKFWQTIPITETLNFDKWKKIVLKLTSWSDHCFYFVLRLISKSREFCQFSILTKYGSQFAICVMRIYSLVIEQNPNWMKNKNYEATPCIENLKLGASWWSSDIFLFSIASCKFHNIQALQITFIWCFSVHWGINHPSTPPLI